MLYLPAILGSSIDGASEKRLEKKTNDVKSLNSSLHDNKELITFFKEKSQTSKNENKNYETVNKTKKSLDSIVINGATLTWMILSITGIRMIVVPLFAGIVCCLALGNKLLSKSVIKNI